MKQARLVFVVENANISNHVLTKEEFEVVLIDIQRGLEEDGYSVISSSIEDTAASSKEA